MSRTDFKKTSVNSRCVPCLQDLVSARKHKNLTIFHPDHVTYEVRLDTYTYIQYNKKNKQIKLEIQDKNNKHW